MNEILIVQALVSIYCSCFFLLVIGSEQLQQQAQNNICNDTMCTYTSSAEYANCKNRDLVYIPPQCSSAVYLDLRKNDLQFLDGTSLAGFLQLKYLYLDGNQIRNITPRAFAQCTMVQQIYLQNNPIVIVRSDVFFGLTNLRQLYLNMAELQQIEPGAFNGLRSLERLYLSDNSLSSLPHDLFHHLTNLQILTLANNHLQALARDAFKGLFQLEYLDIKFNRLASIPEGLFSKLFNLERITLSYNSIDKIKKGDIDLRELRNLETIDFRNNSISTFPNLATQLPQNLKLFFAGNPLYCDCHMEWLQKWYKINQNSSIVTNSGAMAICQGPPSLAGHTMQNITHIQLKCNATEKPPQETYKTAYSTKVITYMNADDKKPTNTVTLDTESFIPTNDDNHTYLLQNDHITKEIVILPYIGIALMVLSAIVITVVVLCCCWHFCTNSTSEISEGYKDKETKPPISPQMHLTINPHPDPGNTFDGYEAVSPDQDKRSPIANLVDFTAQDFDEQNLPPLPPLPHQRPQHFLPHKPLPSGYISPAQLSLLNSRPPLEHSISTPSNATNQPENQRPHSHSQPASMDPFLPAQQRGNPFVVLQPSQVPQHSQPRLSPTPNMQSLIPDQNNNIQTPAWPDICSSNQPMQNPAYCQHTAIPIQGYTKCAIGHNSLCTNPFCTEQHIIQDPTQVLVPQTGFV